MVFRYSLLGIVIVFSALAGAGLKDAIDDIVRNLIQQRIESAFVAEPFEAVRRRVMEARRIMEKCGASDDIEFKEINEQIVTPSIGIFTSQINLASKSPFGKSRMSVSA